MREKLKSTSEGIFRTIQEYVEERERRTILPFLSGTQSRKIQIPAHHNKTI
jgi:hypothetical protein